ncbi:MAG: radical SAM protein, partial [Candidatus Falkowbacteria bacterium]|nr:radical SAM protein [Candidatus Falkowbacteria bacterium]
MKANKPKVILFFPKNDAEVNLLPMSLLLLASPLLNNGFDVKIIDQRINNNWRVDLLQELFDINTIAVGFSVLTGQPINYALAVSRLVKEKSKVKVIWGGVHPSLLPEQTLSNDVIDIVVIGEGEATMLELCQYLVRNQELSLVQGIGYKKDGKIIINAPRDFIDLNQSALPPYYLIDFERYVAQRSFASGQAGRDIDFYTSRGCPYSCGFCYNKEFNRCRWRSQSATKVVEHMEYLVKNFKITSLNIEDDEFFVDKNRSLEICALIKEKKLEFDIFATHRINLIEQLSIKELQELLAAGFKTLAFGVESGSPRILKMINKNISREQVLSAVKKLKEVGMGSKYYFMVGFPGEELEDVYQTTDLMLAMKKIDNSIRIPPWRVYTPYPGTDLYQASIEQGFKAPQRLEDWARFDFEHIRIPWINNKFKNIVYNVMYFNRYLSLSMPAKASFYLKLSRWYGKTVDWRWKRHLFDFVPEKVLIKTWLKIKQLI